MLHTIIQDYRYAARMLRKNPVAGIMGDEKFLARLLLTFAPPGGQHAFRRGA